MKKFLTWVLVLAMVLSLAACGSKPEAPAADNNDAPAQDAPAAPVAEETEPPKTRITVEEGYTMVNFEKGTEGIAFWDLTSFGFVAPDVTLVTAEDAYNGQGMRMEIGGDNTRGVMNLQFVGLAAEINGGMVNAADYEYLRFWVNNQGGADISIAVIPVASSLMKNRVLNPEGAILIDQYGEEVSGWPDNAAEVSTVQGGTRNTSLSIPAGFTGWAYYPLHDQVCWWEGVTLDAEEMKLVDSLTLDMRYIDATEAKYLVIDDICLVTAP